MGRRGDIFASSAYSKTFGYFRSTLRSRHMSGSLRATLCAYLLGFLLAAFYAQEALFGLSITYQSRLYGFGHAASLGYLIILMLRHYRLHRRGSYDKNSAISFLRQYKALLKLLKTPCTQTPGDTEAGNIDFSRFRAATPKCLFHAASHSPLL